MIDGVQIKDLKRIVDDRGFLIELVRESDFDTTISMANKKTDLRVNIPIKQTYITTVREKGTIKGLHYHKIQYDRFIAVSGAIKLVLIDTRIDSPTFEEQQVIILEDMNKSVLIPPKVLHGFQGLTDDTRILNNVSEEYNKNNPDEYHYPSYGTFYVDKTSKELHLVKYTKDFDNDYCFLEINKEIWEIKNR